MVPEVRHQTTKPEDHVYLPNYLCIHQPQGKLKVCLISLISVSFFMLQSLTSLSSSHPLTSLSSSHPLTSNFFTFISGFYSF